MLFAAFVPLNVLARLTGMVHWHVTSQININFIKLLQDTAIAKRAAAEVSTPQPCVVVVKDAFRKANSVQDTRPYRFTCCSPGRVLHFQSQKFVVSFVNVYDMQKFIIICMFIVMQLYYLRVIITPTSRSEF